jgi:propionyl-CoA synthetase
VVGHSYIIYAPLLTGAATVLFEGKPIGTPDSSAFWRIVQDYKVTSLFTAPSKQSSEVQGHEAET